MKKVIFLNVKAIALLMFLMVSTIVLAQPIKVKTPKRPKGQMR